MQRGTWSVPGPREWRGAGVRAAVGGVVLVAVVVGVAAGVVIPSRAGADGLRSNSFSPGPPRPAPCEVYGQRRFLASYADSHRWVDRARTLRGEGREIVFADGNSLYAVSVDGTQLWRPVREVTTIFHVGGRWQYVLKGIVSFDVSGVDGALVYATCWAHRPDGNEPEIPRRGVPWRYPAGDIDFDIGDDLYEITLVRPDEGSAIRLSLGNFPTWSPDGQRIAFVSTYGAAGGDRQSRVHTMAADGTDLHTIELPTYMHAEFPPRWSPDGSRLAFVVIEHDNYGIYTVQANGTGLERLAEARSSPAWSPDGTRLAFAQANRDGDLHVHTMAADGTDVRQVSSTPAGSLQSQFRWVAALAWSPDGSRLLYGCPWRVCVVGLDGQLVGEFGSQRRAQPPAWSADGRRIALYNAAYGRYDEVVLTSIAPDGSDWRVLVREDTGGGLVADQAGNFGFPGPVATRAACHAGVVVPAPAQYPGLVADCEVLVALRAELFGRAGTNWTANTQLTGWEGVVVGGSPPRVRELVLGNGAIGTFDHGGRVPAGIAELAFLERLDLSRNGLMGAIPAAWGVLARLRWLDLAGNKLTGAIPAALGQLGNLQQLWLYDNQLTGTIPPELAQLRHLEVLDLLRNQLAGTIPAELGQLRNLRVLGLSENQLAGTIPVVLGQLRNLEALGLGENHLTGTIPVVLGQLRNLRWLWLNNNQLTGTIPVELAQLRNLQGLRLRDNQLTGCVPVGLKGMDHVEAQLELPDCEAGA